MRSPGFESFGRLYARAVFPSAEWFHGGQQVHTVVGTRPRQRAVGSVEFSKTSRPPCAASLQVSGNVGILNVRRALNP